MSNQIKVDKRFVRQAPVPIKSSSVRSSYFPHSALFPFRPSLTDHPHPTTVCICVGRPPCVSLRTHAKRSRTDTKRYRLLGTAASLPAPTLNVSPPSPVHQSFSPPSPIDGYPATSDTHKPLVDDQSKRGMKSMFRRSGMFGSMFERQHTPYQPTMPRFNRDPPCSLCFCSQSTRRREVRTRPPSVNTKVREEEGMWPVVW